MKKKKLFAFLFIFLFALNTYAIEENREYFILKTPISNAENSVIEIFSYGCIHCYNHHKQNTLAKIKEKLPNLNYKIYPVKPMNNFGEEFAQLFAYALVKDNENKVDYNDKNSLVHKLCDAYFTAVFERKQNWSNSQAFYDLGLSILDINKTKLDAFLESAEGGRIYKSFDEATPIAKNTGTPAFVVNGKYQVILKNVKSSQEFIEIINELSKLK